MESTNLKSWAFDKNGDVVPVNIEVTLMRRLPALVLIGVASEVAARETGERIRGAILASGFEFPRQRVIVTVTGPKSGPEIVRVGNHLDLPIALAILVASGQIVPKGAERNVYPMGELSLGGEVRPTRGMVKLATSLRIPDEAALPLEAALAAAPYVWARTVPKVSTLQEAAAIWGGEVGAWSGDSRSDRPSHVAGLNTEDICGNRHLIGKLVACAVHRRPLILRGVPGCGKTMIAARLGGLLPPLTTDAERELVCTWDLAGLHSTTLRPIERPFRAPHYTISEAGLATGAPRVLRPAEADLAMYGVLFTDECTEFPKASLSALSYKLRSMLDGPHKRRPWWVAACNFGPGWDGQRVDGELRGIQERHDGRLASVQRCMFETTGLEPLIVDVDRVTKETVLDSAERWPSTSALRLVTEIVGRDPALVTRLLTGEPVPDTFEEDGVDIDEEPPGE